MFDDSGVSLSASDPNPSIDQFDDGGSSSEFSSTVNSVAQWGTEIAGLVTGRAVAPSGGYIRTGAPYPAPIAMKSSTKMLILVLGAGALAVGIYTFMN
jgi:hypothetical protein